MISSEVQSERIHGLDLIRLLCFIPICYFHGTLLYFYTPGIELSKESPIIAYAEIFTRSLAFAGFGIVFFLSMLLSYGKVAIEKKIRLFAVLLFGWIFLSFFIYTPKFYGLNWDVYSLLLTGLLSIFLAQRYLPRLGRIMPLMGLGILWVPIWQFLNDLPYLGWHGSNVMGTALCVRDVAEWPLLPWVGLVWAGAGMGSELRRHQTRSGSITLAWEKKEAWLWPLIIAPLLPHLGGYYSVVLGRFFSCSYYRQPPFIFFAHLIVFVFLIRLMLLPSLQRFLTQYKAFRWVSNLWISRYYAVAYMGSYGTIHVLNWTIPPIFHNYFPEVIPLAEKLFFSAMVFLFLPLVEIVTWRLVIHARNVMDFITQLKQRNPEAGFALNAVNLSAGFAMATLAAMGTIEVNRSKQAVELKALRARDEIAENLIRVLQNPAAIYASSLDPRNSVLGYCVENPDSLNCPEGRGEQEFELSIPIDSAFGAVKVSNRALPPGLSLDGQVCAGVNQTCPFSVKTYFSVAGPPVAANDPPRGTMSLRFDIFKLTKTGSKSVKILDSLSRANLVTYQKDSIKRSARYLCPANTEAIGTDEKGNLICDCQRNLVRDPSSTNSKRPSCIDPQSCPSGQLLVSFNNGIPVCRAVNLDSGYCDYIPITNPDNFGCVNGGLIDKAFRGVKDISGSTCRFRWDDGSEPDAKGTFWGSLICDRYTAICCSISR